MTCTSVPKLAIDERCICNYHHVYASLRKFPKEEQYALCDQLRRAVISIPSNIAEGSGRTSAKDQAHFFLEMAYGSLMEVDCQLDIACDLGYVSQEELVPLNMQIDRIASMLSGMRRKLLGPNSLTR